ncbi:SHOCT domain-containing protein [Oscillibacter valericigenes]|uniref:SHOCT domain-containing protein n=2 Tax=Oscillibacter valericigenes TaxID=351091 RepID=A0ABS2FX87_9FIRM|nr:SHOCT domain-containing protein [Oscillibacter valericigenes]MBM6910581.1 SHOCT domain-containing protein [Oscillibacter valericigenes]
MLFIVAMIHISLLPDKNARPAPPPSPPPRKPPAWGAADEIRKYKELLDSGILTQEEFDRKKAQLLDL